MRRKRAMVGGVLAACLSGLVWFSTAQEHPPGNPSVAPGERSIKSEDFARRRPIGADVRPGAAARPRPRYRWKASDAVGVGEKPASSGSGADGQAVKTGQEAASPQLLGLTLWRLRPLRPGEPTTNAVRVQNADRSGWHWRIPERSSLARPVALGDILRLTVEAGREGYLYIINHELRRDGSRGTPVLLFPESAAVNNFVRPGELVDLPDRRENWPYFRLSSSDPDYAGEMLWLILSPRRIEGWRTTADRVIQNQDLAADLERQASPGGLYELERGEGEAETAAEAAATSGNVERGQSRSLESGLGAERRLKQDGPLPQSVYAAEVGAEAVIVVPVRLRKRI